MPKLKGFIERIRGVKAFDSIFVGGKEIPALCTFAISQNATQYYSEVEIAVCNKEGEPVGQPCIIDLWLSDAATGLGLAANAPASGIALKANCGTAMGTLTTNKALRVQTLATGKVTLVLQDDVTPVLLYVAASIPGSGQFSISRKTVAGDYKP